MSYPIQRPDINVMLHSSAEELSACHHQMSTELQGQVKQFKIDDRRQIDHLMNTIENANMVLTKEINADRILRIDPKILSEIEQAIEIATSSPLTIDNKINEIYISIFGWNTPLWHALREMQRLLRTVEVLKDTRGKKVAKVEKSEKERRKRRGHPK